jgi:hypothetical protein
MAKEFICLNKSGNILGVDTKQVMNAEFVHSEYISLFSHDIGLYRIPQFL